MQRDDESLVNDAEAGPLVVTGLQIAIFHQFQELGVSVSSVIGHSTGEVAAAYAAGYLNLREAVTIAYYYGYVTRKPRDGAMAAVPLGVQQLEGTLTADVVMACENSPSSTTLSGDRAALEETLDLIKKSNAGIKTSLLHVKVAYHSRESKNCSMLSPVLHF